VTGTVRHLYVHLPFCAHRCGYCDFVTVVGRTGDHAAYAEAVLVELELARPLLAERLETVFVGGGTPTFTEERVLARVLAALPEASEVTVEANPETVTPRLAALLRDGGVTRVSLGAQSFEPSLLDVLERRAKPGDVRRAVHTLRDVNFDNISLDLLYGIPGQSAAQLERDLAEALALAPEHLSCYELEAKPGTRFAHAWGNELARQAEAMEGYFWQVVERLEGAGFRWYETANFCRLPQRDGRQRDLRAQHNLGIWRGHDYVGLGVGAVSTVAGERRRNDPSLRRYEAALLGGAPPPSAREPLDDATRALERVMLGLRLDESLALVPDLEPVIDRAALDRMEERGLVARSVDAGSGAEQIALTRRGRFVGGAVTAELLRWPEGVDELEPAAASATRPVD
jgi:oxygen-independent coproporphyrinogen-3 oxidase